MKQNLFMLEHVLVDPIFIGKMLEPHCEKQENN